MLRNWFSLFFAAVSPGVLVVSAFTLQMGEISTWSPPGVARFIYLLPQ
jgi:hypothetical protein